jgi:hypothetical protein
LGIAVLIFIRRHSKSWETKSSKHMNLIPIGMKSKQSSLENEIELGNINEVSNNKSEVDSKGF